MAGDRGAAPAVTGDLAGVYQYDAAHDSWWWSREIFRIHGLTPGEVSPSTKLLLEHQHPDDREHTREAVDGCLEDGEPFSCYHRIVTADGTVRRVVVVGDGQKDGSGRVIGMRGFLIDVTEPVTREIREIADETIAAARRSQETIDQARGILMGVYGVDASTAFAMLRRHSQHTNTRLRDVATALVEAVPTPPGSRGLRTELRQRMERALYSGATPKD